MLKFLIFLQSFGRQCFMVVDALFKPGFHIIVTIVAIAENGCDDPEDHVETPIFFSVMIMTIRITTIVEIGICSISTILAIK